MKNYLNQMFSIEFFTSLLLLNQLERKHLENIWSRRERNEGKCNKKSEKSMGRTSESTGVVLCSNSTFVVHVGRGGGEWPTMDSIHK